MRIQKTLNNNNNTYNHTSSSSSSSKVIASSLLIVLILSAIFDATGKSPRPKTYLFFKNRNLFSWKNFKNFAHWTSHSHIDFLSVLFIPPRKFTVHIQNDSLAYRSNWEKKVSDFCLEISLVARSLVREIRLNLGRREREGRKIRFFLKKTKIFFVTLAVNESLNKSCHC